jgi:hypothetical protein
MSNTSLLKIAGGSRPLVHQTVNTCGLASLAMNFMHHSKAIDAFLEDVFRAKFVGGKKLRIQPGNHDAAIIWAEGFLLAKARTSRRVGNWLKKTTGEFQYEDFKVNIDMLVESMWTREARHDASLATALKYFKHGTIRKVFMVNYLEQFKNQLELKILASMLGFQFLPYPGDVMGNLYFERGDTEAKHKIEYMQAMMEQPSTAVIVGHGQSHWMVPHTLYKDTGSVDGKDYSIGVNDPLGSSTHMVLKRFDNAWLFYFFNYDAQRCDEGIAFLSDLLGLKRTGKK